MAPPGTPAMSVRSTSMPPIETTTLASVPAMALVLNDCATISSAAQAAASRPASMPTSGNQSVSSSGAYHLS